MSDETLHVRPTPKRPENGLLAWQATIGYISAEHSPDAVLSLYAYPVQDVVAWAAAVMWGQNRVVLRDLPDLPAVLKSLWWDLSKQHKIFKSMDAAAKAPANYPDHQWIDAPTQAALDRLIQITHAAFEDDWMLTLVYQPISDPNSRVQADLLARNQTVTISGKGASIRDACRDLYRSAAPGIFAVAGKPRDEILG